MTIWSHENVIFNLIFHYFCLFSLCSLVASRPARTGIANEAYNGPQIINRDPSAIKATALAASTAHGGAVIDHDPGMLMDFLLT